MELTLGSLSKSQRRKEGSPLRILILSQLSSAPHNAASSFTPQRVNIDNFETVLLKVEPKTGSTSGAGSSVDGVPFKSLDDFHPDSLARVLGSIHGLRALSARLADPATEQVALEELAAITGDGPARAGSSGLPSGPGAGVATGARPADGAASAGPSDEAELFGRLLGRARAPDEPRSKAQQTVQGLIADALGGQQTAKSSGLAAIAMERVRELLNERMRANLMAPAFRELERAWRSLHWLVSRIDDDYAEIFVVDVSKEALRTHLQAHRAQLDTSALHRLLCEHEPGWDVIVGDYSFGLNADDLVLLATLGALAARGAAPFLAHGELSLAGCPGPKSIEAPWEWALPDDELGNLWRELRAHPAANWIALAAPRFMLRYPYGRKSDPITAFDFEELPARPSADRFLWGNPAFACALLMAQAHGAGTSHWPAAAIDDVQDLPTPIYNDGTGEAMQPAIEFLLNERARAVAEQSGLVTFISGRNTNRMSASGIGPIAAARA